VVPRSWRAAGPISLAGDTDSIRSAKKIKRNAPISVESGVGRPCDHARDRTQITTFGRSTGSHAGDRVAAQIGGSVRSHLDIVVTFRDNLVVTGEPLTTASADGSRWLLTGVARRVPGGRRLGWARPTRGMRVCS